MIGEIIKQIYNEQMMRQLYEIPQVTSCLFRSFDSFTQNLIFRMMTNGGELQQKDVLAEISQSSEKENSLALLRGTLDNLDKLQIITRQNYGNLYRMNPVFEAKLNEYILSPQRVQGEPLPADYVYDEDFFNLLHLVREPTRQNTQIMRHCNLSRLDENSLTRDNFNFIRSPISYKIAILVKGYLKYKKRSNPKILKDILYLSLMKPRQCHRIPERSQQVIAELQSIKLVRRVNAGLFIISDYLHNFGFQDCPGEKQLLKCRVIIETNFKVYTQVRSDNKDNYELLKTILRSLLKVEHENYNFGSELIVGQIHKDKLIELFRQNITANDFFNFFKLYMDEDLTSEKDLGKWNKLKFLGLEGPSSQTGIPNNIRQEVKLWETLKEAELRDFNTYQEQQEDQASDLWLS